MNDCSKILVKKKDLLALYGKSLNFSIVAGNSGEKERPTCIVC